MSSMARGQTASERAAELVAEVHDDPPGRMGLLARTYDGPAVGSRRHEPFRRAALSFMHWQAQRGVLRALDGSPPGSPWWRSVNERLLLDGCEARARADGLAGPPSSQTIEHWMSFFAQPTPRSWYRAHNATIVSGYLEHRGLAEQESEPERFFCNVALLRVLYAHALVAAPRLSLGRFGVLGPMLGDPRLGMAGVFLSLHRVLPDRYPLDDAVETHLANESSLGRLLDFGLIGSRTQALYEWSAQELGIESLCELVHDGSPVYAWSYGDRHVWSLERAPVPLRALRQATAARTL
jgi:hypothetical protein